MGYLFAWPVGRFVTANKQKNRLVVLNDRKIGVDDDTDGIVDRYQPDVVSAADYSAYGENLKGREFNSSLIQFGFNGKWNDAETRCLTSEHVVIQLLVINFVSKFFLFFYSRNYSRFF